MKNEEFAKNTLDQIPESKPNAKKITALIKEKGRVMGYKLSDNTTVSKTEAINMAKQGNIQGVGIAHKGDTEYLKSVPNDTENDNLGNLPTVDR